MTTKTWKLGELSRGGIVTVEIKKNKVTVIAKDWDTSAGYSRGSNQSNAKEWDRLEVIVDGFSRNGYSLLNDYLNDLTTSYHASKIIEWIESKLSLDI